MSIIDPKELHHFPEWMQHAAEIESTCLSVAVGGLASKLGMIDRDQVLRYRAAVEASAAADALAGASPDSSVAK